MKRSLVLGLLGPLFLMISALFLVGFLVPSASAEDCPAGVKSASLPNLKVGTWWLLRRSGGEELRMEVKAITSDRIIMLDSTRPGIDVEYTKDYNALDTVNPRGELMRVSPHARSASFPICPGKKWSGAINASPLRGGGRGYSYNLFVEVKEWEKIEVPAGSFEAIKIEYKAGPGSTTCWYAPEAQRSVKCSSPSNPLNNFELMKFELSQ
jgi:hypothetical protein